MEDVEKCHVPVDPLPLFREGIGLVLYCWSALQSALEKEVELLCSDIFTWFSSHKAFCYFVDDLERLLNNALHCLNIMANKYIVTEVAETLIVMHKKCLDGDFRCIESLRQLHRRRVAHSHGGQAVIDTGEEGEDRRWDEEFFDLMEDDFFLF